LAPPSARWTTCRRNGVRDGARTENDSRQTWAALRVAASRSLRSPRRFVWTRYIIRASAREFGRAWGTRSNPRSPRTPVRTATWSFRFRASLHRMEGRFQTYCGIPHATALKTPFAQGTTTYWITSGKTSLSNFSRRYCARFIFIKRRRYFPAIWSAKSAAIGTRNRSC